MKFAKRIGVLAVLACAGVFALAAAPSVSGHFDSRVHAQGKLPGVDALAQREQGSRALTVLAGRGAEIGVSIRDVEKAEADRQHVTGGAVVEEVHPDTPADKAGLKKSDIIVEFDGERVRSARQFSRLVQETVPGREVKTTIVRDGQKKDLQLTPSEGRGEMSMFMNGGALRNRLGDLGDLSDLPHLADRMRGFNFNFDIPGALSGRRLGVTVDELTNQLAGYFGVKDGVLVTAVTDGTAASRAGLKAGDVITSIDGTTVRSREDLVRALRDARSDEVTIGIVRDKKESSVKATLEGPSRRPVRGARPA
ncbi:MAG: PDZ domain-containing protein [Acidobacteria bacterium]|nr:PDZ domain-containing protein [Acidobacteriota bacterium]